MRGGDNWVNDGGEPDRQELVIQADIEANLAGIRGLHGEGGDNN